MFTARQATSSCELWAWEPCPCLYLWPVMVVEDHPVQMCVWNAHRWDDRTLHCNAPGLGPAPATPTLLRSCGYISYSPRALADEHKLAQRRAACREGRGSGHTGDCAPGLRMGTDPKYSAFKFAGLTYEDLDGEQKALVG
jgi:hypothetical protein